MKEIHILESPLKSSEQQHEADMHSVINLLGVIVSVLSLLEHQVTTGKKCIVALSDEIIEAAQAVRQKDSVHYAFQRIEESRQDILNLVIKIALETRFPEEKTAAEEAYSNLVSIYEVASERIAELKLRSEDPDMRITLDAPNLKHKFVQVFRAIEKNSNGLYRIRFNLALKEQKDYYIDLNIESHRKDGQLYIPLRMVDVLRDLTANSRKYTEPGGRIALAMVQDDELIRCTIEDNGMGIPENELDKVVQYGYRASNVLHKQTKGGGFGLSKAAWLILEWGGTFSIASELNRGSVLKIVVPIVA
ncbi:MAG: ATP-binding protein [Puniceicoccaceae bacterium]